MTEKKIDLAGREGGSAGKAEQCHLMPCRIESDGSHVKAQEYFWPTIRPVETGLVHGEKSLLTASFRGRPLQGRKLSIPKGYKACVIGKKKIFNEFTYWNWDELPNETDSVVKALQWIDIAKAIHD